MKTIKKVEITPIYVTTMPDVLEENAIYISEEYGVSVHNCLCGCGVKTALPLSDGEWKLIKHDDGKISFTPSIGNFSGEDPYHAHYIITKNIANFV